MKPRRYLVWTIVAVICVCIVSYGGYLSIENQAYMHVEELTRKYAHEVEPFVEQFAGEYNLNIVYFKVFEYDQVRAKVFVVERQDPQEGKDASGSFLHLKRSQPGGSWELASPPECVWSLAGSADGRTWPPYGPTDPYTEPED